MATMILLWVMVAFLIYLLYGISSIKLLSEQTGINKVSTLDHVTVKKRHNITHT